MKWTAISRLPLIIAAVTALLILPPNANAAIKVAASIYPLAHFAKQVGGSLTDVETIIPAGVEPHEFEPAPKDIRRIYSSRVFIFNGAGIDLWAEKIAPDLEKTGVLTVNMTSGITLQQHHGRTDPHTWLDPVFAQKEVEIIRDSFAKADHENGQTYRTGAEVYLGKLRALDKKFRDGLKSCTTRKIVVTHGAFAYLAQRYNLETLVLSGLSPSEEPSPRRLGEAVTTARAHGIKYIFFESLVSPKIAETVAREIGASTLVLNPLEGLTPADAKAGRDYISIMEGNLKNLRTALSCQ
ncbi:metal ABC transporter solute-binding protein, Zn/Mn family [Candidatus Magnetominusculus xianensis]|uniref:ABC transporter substrate-binding protein n=1 Tax=Candidatus Magnetominusculus xianensis TaxID=1748249 RepID=A0ABR5SBT6_9BACT|nr:zinc ABC transporter substrate-binding protein [Candidatus Magnetominusculus xianensis]KWT78195.1 ABC transporter substrate-binding protein [Candidatus Magnetominusculus xianensis]MBF0402853.1 zinc ABC transporter substrate-binding protein [Nitrospirota bacterium]